MSGMKRIRLILVGLLLISGCASNPLGYPDEQAAAYTAQILNGTALGGEPIPEPEVDLLSLRSDIKQMLDQKIDPRMHKREKLDRVRNLMFGEDQLNIQYASEATLTASETFDQRAGNCLAMTSLFIAAARHVGLDADFQVVNVRPTWDFEGRTMIRYEHIVATGRITGEYYVMDFLPEFVLDGAKSTNVQDSIATSLYHANRGAELLIEEEFNGAYAQLRRALRLNPESSDIWTNIGALFSRTGKARLAEFAYRKALSLDGYNYSALNNLATFYRRQGNEDMSEYYADRVKRYRHRNPYYHYFVAQMAFENRMYDESRALLERALSMKFDEPDFYEALARVEELQGNKGEAKALLAKAKYYSKGKPQPPLRENNHRLFTQVIEIN